MTVLAERVVGFRSPTEYTGFELDEGRAGDSAFTFPTFVHEYDPGFSAGVADEFAVVHPSGSYLGSLVREAVPGATLYDASLSDPVTVGTLIYPMAPPVVGGSVVGILHASAGAAQPHRFFGGLAEARTSPRGTAADVTTVPADELLALSAEPSPSPRRVFLATAAEILESWYRARSEGLLEVPDVTRVAEVQAHDISRSITHQFWLTVAHHATRPRVRELVLDQLADLLNTPEPHRAPWATWPVISAFEDAMAFVRAWPGEALVMPDVGLADDGEVNFLWKGVDLHVDLGFYGDGTFSYYAKDGDGEEYAGDDVVANVGLPEDLLALLKA